MTQKNNPGASRGNMLTRIHFRNANNLNQVQDSNPPPPPPHAFQIFQPARRERFLYVTRVFLAARLSMTTVHNNRDSNGLRISVSFAIRTVRSFACPRPLCYIAAVRFGLRVLRFIDVHAVSMRHEDEICCFMEKLARGESSLRKSGCWHHPADSVATCSACRALMLAAEHAGLVRSGAAISPGEGAGRGPSGGR